MLVVRLLDNVYQINVLDAHDILWDDKIPDCQQCGCPMVDDNGQVLLAMDESIVECSVCGWKAKVTRG